MALTASLRRFERCYGWMVHPSLRILLERHTGEIVENWEDDLQDVLFDEYERALGEEF